MTKKSNERIMSERRRRSEVKEVDNKKEKKENNRHLRKRNFTSKNFAVSLKKKSGNELTPFLMKRKCRNSIQDKFFHSKTVENYKRKFETTAQIHTSPGCGFLGSRIPICPQLDEDERKGTDDITNDNSYCQLY